MTDATMALRQMLEKGSDGTLLHEMIGFAAQRLMELEVGEVTGAAHGERSPASVEGVVAVRPHHLDTATGGRPAIGFDPAPHLILALGHGARLLRSLVRSRANDVGAEAMMAALTDLPAA